ncbi:hypothetical protein ACQUFE_18625, partial [Enterococcus casseliflavus]
PKHLGRGVGGCHQHHTMAGAGIALHRRSAVGALPTRRRGSADARPHPVRGGGAEQTDGAYHPG